MVKNDRYTSLGATDPSIIGRAGPPMCFSRSDQKRMTRRIRFLESQIRRKVKVIKFGKKKTHEYM